MVAPLAGCTQPLVSQHGPTPAFLPPPPQVGCVSGVVAIPALDSWLCGPGHFSCLSQGNVEPTAPVLLLLWDCCWSEHPEFGMFSVWFIMKNQMLLHLTRGFNCDVCPPSAGLRGRPAPTHPASSQDDSERFFSLRTQRRDWPWAPAHLWPCVPPTI